MVIHNQSNHQIVLNISNIDGAVKKLMFLKMKSICIYLAKLLELHMNCDSPILPSFPTSPTLLLFLLHFLCTSHPYVSYFYASSKCLFFLSYFHPPYSFRYTTSFHHPLKTFQLFPMPNDP